MSWSGFLFISLFSFVLLFLYLILGLNGNIVIVDLLFYEIEVNQGMGLIASFLIGSLITLLLEIFYFSYKRKDNRKD